MRRLALASLAIAAILYVPVPLVAHERGVTNALVPVSEIPPEVQVPSGTGVAEAPAAGTPAPAPAPEEAPELVPTDEMEPAPASRAGAIEAPDPEPTAVPALQPNAELAQDVPTTPDTP